MIYFQINPTKIMGFLFLVVLILVAGCTDIQDSIYCSECKERCMYVHNFTLDISTNMCCFPSDCTQSKNNPRVCTCEYMVKCIVTKQNSSHD